MDKKFEEALQITSRIEKALDRRGDCGAHGYLYGFLVGLLILIIIGLTVTVYNFGVYSEKIVQLEDLVFNGKYITTEVDHGKR